MTSLEKKVLQCASGEKRLKPDYVTILEPMQNVSS